MKLIFSYFLYALTAAAASISGTVVDPFNRPIAGANVSCGGRRTATGAEGRFTLEGAPCEAIIESDGFGAVRVTLEPGATNRIQLAVAALSERVLVTATRVAATLEEAGVSATIFSEREIAARQYAPVADLLRDVPGMAVVTSGRRGGLTSVFTRGGASTGTLFLLDGIATNDPGGQIDLANLSTAGLDRVEAVRGPESTLFGAEAAAGVVQLFTARGDAESRRPHGQLSYERGNMQTDHWRANLNGGVAGRADYSLTADQFHTTGMFVNDYYRNTNGTANLGWHITRATQLRAIYREFDTAVGTPNQVAYGIFDRDARNQNRDSALSLRADDARGTHFVQNFYYNYHRLSFRSLDAVIDGPYVFAGLIRTIAGNLPKIYFEGLADPNTPASQLPTGVSLVKKSVTLFPFPNASRAERKDGGYQGAYTHSGGALVFGYAYDRQEGLVSGGNVARNNNGFYIHEQYKSGRFYLTGGARIEHSSTFGNKFAPRGAISYAITPSTFVRLSAGRGITEPSLLQNFAQEGFYVGNPKLRPELTTSFDFGVVQEFFGRRVRVEATAFRNSFRDLIVFDFALNPASWSNIDRSWGRGVETVFTVRPVRYIQISANWIRLYTKITRTTSTSAYNKTGAELLRRPKDSGSAWISVTPKRWSFIAGGRFVGERQDSDFLFGLTRNPGYGTAWVSASYTLSRHVTPFFRVDNLFNERYQEVLGFTSLSRNGTGGMRLTW